MKISEIVNVNLSTSPLASGIITAESLNNTAGVLIVMNELGTSDTKWQTSAALLAVGVSFTAKNAFERLVTTYSNNGGVNLVAKRIYSQTLTEDTIVNEMIAAINGGTSHEAVATNIINIMIIDESNVVLSSIGTIAQAVQNTSSPEEEKILMLNLSSSYSSFGLSNINNVFINWYDRKPDGTAPTQNNYEVALAAAYVSRINYTDDIIKGFEYTPFYGYVASSNNLNIAAAVPNPESNGGIYVNIITYLVDRYLTIGGVMTNGSNFMARYFEIVLTQKITTELARLVISKIKFENTTYSAISNSLTALLDVFAKNQLLDMEYISDVNKTVVINEMSGNVTYQTVSVGEVFTEGYKVFTLPPSQYDVENKTYSGVYTYIAIGNQIHEINVNGLLLGGI